MNRRSLIVAASAAALSACASRPTAGRGFALTSEIDAIATRAMEFGLTPGLALAVYTREGVYTRAFGVTDARTREPANADTAFYIASSTKSFTALALAALHQRGEFNLDETLAGYAADAPFPDAVAAGETRFRQMLSHTSGIANGPIGYRVAYTGQHDQQTLWRLLAQSEVNTEATRGRFQYTNDGYNITTVLTDHRLGVPWQDLLEREVFTPAGFRRTSARMSRASTQGWSVARPHSISTTAAMERIYLEKTDQTMQSAGGMIVSANDAARWLELMIEGGRIGRQQVIAPEAVATVLTRQTEVQAEFEDYMRDGYGLGWYLGPYRDERMVQHFGGFAGFRSHISFLPSRGVGVVALANSGVGEVCNLIANYVYDRVCGYSDAEQRAEAALGELSGRLQAAASGLAASQARRAGRPWTLTRPRAAYGGAYENDVWGRIEVATNGDDLAVRYGVLNATAEPFTDPDSIRVEFVPLSGEPIIFGGDEARPVSLRTRSGVFHRV